MFTAKSRVPKRAVLRLHVARMGPLSGSYRLGTALDETGRHPSYQCQSEGFLRASTPTLIFIRASGALPSCNYFAAGLNIDRASIFLLYHPYGPKCAE